MLVPVPTRNPKFPSTPSAAAKAPTAVPFSVTRTESGSTVMRRTLRPGLSGPDGPTNDAACSAGRTIRDAIPGTDDDNRSQ